MIPFIFGRLTMTGDTVRDAHRVLHRTGHDPLLRGKPELALDAAERELALMSCGRVLVPSAAVVTIVVAVMVVVVVVVLAGMQ